MRKNIIYNQLNMGAKVMKAQIGIYESLINKAMSKQISLSKDEFQLLKEDIDSTEASDLIATYLFFVMKKGLNYYRKNREDLLKQIEIANNLIEKFSYEIQDSEFVDYKIDNEKI